MPERGNEFSLHVGIDINNIQYCSCQKKIMHIVAIFYLKKYNKNLLKITKLLLKLLLVLIYLFLAVLHPWPFQNVTNQNFEFLFIWPFQNLTHKSDLGRCN